MSKAKLLLSTPFAIAVLTVVSLPALAGVQRTFVASNGADTNPCSLTQPCRAFAAALLQTNAGGEIIVLDSAGYGPVVIDKAVSIIAPAGIYAGVTATSGNGIVVNAPGAAVVLRGLEINGTGTSAGSGHPESGGREPPDRSLHGERIRQHRRGRFGESGIRILAGPVTIANTVVKQQLPWRHHGHAAPMPGT